MDNIREWFACYEANKYSGKVVCKGGFTTSIQANDFLVLNGLNTNEKSYLISACKFMHHFMKEIRIRREFYKKQSLEIVVT